MELKNINIGFAITGSFCTHAQIPPVLKELKLLGANVIPIISESVQTTNSRFGVAAEFIEIVTQITGNTPITSITGAEPIGPKDLLDVLVIAPCTGNTLAKIANAINDSIVTMACKAHLRNLKPVVIAISTNDALGANAKNLGLLLGMKQMYFVPFLQDDPAKKCNSLVAKMDLIVPTVVDALKGYQIQPIILS